MNTGDRFSTSSPMVRLPLFPLRGGGLSSARRLKDVSFDLALLPSDCSVSPPVEIFSLMGWTMVTLHRPSALPPFGTYERPLGTRRTTNSAFQALPSVPVEDVGRGMKTLRKIVKPSSGLPSLLYSILCFLRFSPFSPLAFSFCIRPMIEKVYGLFKKRLYVLLSLKDSYRMCGA